MMSETRSPERDIERMHTVSATRYWWRRSVDEQIEARWIAQQELDRPLTDVEDRIIYKLLRILQKEKFEYKYSVPRLIIGIHDLGDAQCLINFVLKDNRLQISLFFPGEIRYSRLPFLYAFTADFNVESKFAIMVPNNGRVELRYNAVAVSEDDITEESFRAIWNDITASANLVRGKVQNFLI